MQIPAGHLSSVLAMHATTAAFRAGTITDPEYRARIDAFWRSMGIDPSGGTPAVAPAAGGAAAGRPQPSSHPRGKRRSRTGWPAWVASTPTVS